MTVAIPLTRGAVAIVDDADADFVLAAGSWYAEPGRYTMYGCRRVSGALIRMHTLITGWALVDHIDRDGTNNTRANLRPATHSQNGANQAVRSSNTSGYKGVSLHAGSGRWRATIRVERQYRHLGYFAEATDAAVAYDSAALHAFGDFAYLNFPQKVTL